jgi:uncharacterized protein YpmS
MPITRQKGAIIMVLAALILASLACNMPAINWQAPATETIPVSTEEVQNLEVTLEAAAATAQSNQSLTIQVTEAQLTSLVALELSNQEDPILHDPQVFLRDGQIELHGNVHQGGLVLPLSMIVTVSIDEQGKPDYQVVSANLGPLPLPQSMLDQLSGQLDQTLANEMGPELEKVFIEDITIADGVMTIAGRTR